MTDCHVIVQRIHLHVCNRWSANECMFWLS